MVILNTTIRKKRKYTLHLFTHGELVPQEYLNRNNEHYLENIMNIYPN